ncbi:hypothetical protein E2I00_013573 [Balaenoptera physalus]|uniref:EF-hand domain-containing protein n=1 Tax=Balaenoptera physalus TaxID=9770 RepID=A0A643BQ19_BALPH|nr:hypothetical protein E2I00_013573 [Balaenoptera physalus]
MAGPQQQQPPYLHLAELTASQFLEIWKHFDADGNGYIEGKELENFFQELEKARKGSGMMSKSDNFGEKMKEFMQKYDKNADGKIEMAEVSPSILLRATREGPSVACASPMHKSHSRDPSELAQILPTEENFLLCFRQHVGSSTEFMEGMKLTSEEFNAIFAFYDKDGSGYIDENELDALLKDLYEKNKKEMNIQQLTSYRKSVMSLAEAGKLYRKDLEIVLCSEPPM